VAPYDTKPHPDDSAIRVRSPCLASVVTDERVTARVERRP